MDIIHLYNRLPKTTVAQVLGKQLLRSATSVGSHYHEGTRSRSNAEFISKLEGGLQELAESDYWLDLLERADVLKPEETQPRRTEIDELTAIFVSIVKRRKEQ
ncbi:MAG: four helix bundle protein [Armatimonadota bacterium]